MSQRLDGLLDDRLVAIGPRWGAAHTKGDDQAGCRSGSSVLTELVQGDVGVLIAGTTGVTLVTTKPGSGAGDDSE